MGEWTTDGEWGAKFDAQGIHVIARTSGDFEIWFGAHLLEGDSGTCSLDAAKAAAEQALREMHGALSRHFAPVLRWQTEGDGYCAEAGPWTLLVQPDGWVVGVVDMRQEFVIVREDAFAPSFQTPCESRGAAETALRELGVVFRVEGEP